VTKFRTIFCVSLGCLLLSVNFYCSRQPEQKAAQNEATATPVELPVSADTSIKQTEPIAETPSVQEEPKPTLLQKLFHHEKKSETNTKTRTITQIVQKSDTLSVANINVVINVPCMALPNDTIIIDASHSFDPLDAHGTLLFRFDANGDGVWDYPASGFAPDKAVQYAFPKEGVYTIAVEAQGKAGRVGRAEMHIMVRNTPTAIIDVRPQMPLAGSVCTLDASKSIVSSLGNRTFTAKWDIDNCGKWESFSSGLSALKKLNGAGPFPVGLLIRDEAGLYAKAISEISTTPVFRVMLVLLPDTVIADMPFTASCQTSYPPSQIGVYEWDFTGAGKFDIKTDQQSFSHEFSKAGVYKVSCRAIARNGNMSTASRTVVVVSRSVVIKLKTQKQTQSMVSAVFDADITTRHTKIAQVAWDYDGDNVFDWSGTSIAKTKYSFPKPGTFHPVLRVISDDKHEWFDTTTITVIPNVPPRAIAGKNILAESGDNIELEGKGVVSGGSIILYEWDFDGDGSFDWKSEKSGTVRHVFATYSHPVLRVTSESGATACDTMSVVICPQDMIGINENPHCIDMYEFPNKKGQVPVVNVTLAEAAQFCKKEGKHLCSADEWERACSGRNKQQYPASSSQYALQPCNVQTKDSPGHMVQSGSFTDCQSAYGVYDMNGNVAEWTAPAKNDNAFAYGGSWLFPQENASCSSKMELKASKGYPYVGFRCCK